MSPTTVFVPAVHARRTTIANAHALLDLASRVAVATVIALDQYDQGTESTAFAVLTRLRRHPDVLALRRYLDVSPPA